MSHSVTYTSSDLARNKIKIRILCAQAEQKSSTGPKHIYIILYDRNQNNYG